MACCSVKLFCCFKHSRYVGKHGIVSFDMYSLVSVAPQRCTPQDLRTRAHACSCGAAALRTGPCRAGG